MSESSTLASRSTVRARLCVVWFWLLGACIAGMPPVHADEPASDADPSGDDPMLLPHHLGWARVADARRQRALAEPEDAAAEDNDEEEDDRITDIPEALDEVVWTVGEPSTAEEVAQSWGVRTSYLLKLNPELEREAQLEAGARLVVFRRDPERATMSIERPTDGTLRRGVPLPEGQGWHSPSRRFQWGTQLAVTTLVGVMESYAQAFPEAGPLRVGDLSRRKGGEIKRSHESHQSGRDVDLGYPRFDEVPDDATDAPPVTAETLDVEKTWFLIESLLATGRVQVIFVDKEIQTLLDAHVAERYTKQQRAKLFEHPRRVHSHRAIIQHWDHHDDHLHVRFVCDPGNWRCRGNGVWGE